MRDLYDRYSPWYIIKNKTPEIPGVYMRGEDRDGTIVMTHFSYWNGEYFGYVGYTPEDALKVWNNFNGKSGRKSCHQNHPWRGLIKGK